MLVSPEVYVEQFKDASLAELIEERNGLYEQIRDFENNCIDFEKGRLITDGEEWFIDPMPDVIYRVYLEYVSAICNLICENFSEEYK